MAGSPYDRQLMGALRGKAIDCGSDTATWTANKNSAITTVAHRLGRVPVFAKASSRDVTFDYAVVARDEDTIDVRGFVTDGTPVTDTLTFDWFVIG